MKYIVGSVRKHLVTQNTDYLHNGFVNLPCNMWTGVHEDRLKVFGEFWSFLLAVLDDIIGQIQKCQLPVAFSWDKFSENVEEKTLECILNHLAIHVLLVIMSKMSLDRDFFCFHVFHACFFFQNKHAYSIFLNFIAYCNNHLFSVPCATL